MKAKRQDRYANACFDSLKEAGDKEKPGWNARFINALFRRGLAIIPGPPRRGDYPDDGDGPLSYPAPPCVEKEAHQWAKGQIVWRVSNEYEAAKRGRIPSDAAQILKGITRLHALEWWAKQHSAIRDAEIGQAHEQIVQEASFQPPL